MIRSIYEGTSEENSKNLLAVLAPNATWIEAAGFSHAGTYIGAATLSRIAVRVMSLLGFKKLSAWRSAPILPLQACMVGKQAGIASWQACFRA